MQVYKDGQIAHYKQIFPRTSFPKSGPTDEFLSEAGAYKVNVFKEHNRETQKLVPCDPYIENGWAYAVRVEEKTEEEIAADILSKAAQVRAARDGALKASDWRVIRAAELGVSLDEEWAAYRQALRDLPQDPDFPNVELPRDPDFVDIGQP